MLKSTKTVFFFTIFWNQAFSISVVTCNKTAAHIGLKRYRLYIYGMKNVIYYSFEFIKILNPAFDTYNFWPILDYARKEQKFCNLNFHKCYRTINLVDDIWYRYKIYFQILKSIP